MATLQVACDADTEELVQFILDCLEKDELDDLERKEVDDIEVVRKSEPTTGLSGEPLTIAATITLATILVPRVARIIERWMEHRQQLKELDIVAKGFARSDKEGIELARVAAAHAKVSISYALERSPKTGTK
jgi:hypothetical protein